MIAAIYSFLVLQAASALATIVVRGFPRWANPTMVPPLAALEYTTLAPAGNRIGQKNARHALGLRLYVFADNDPDLGQMLDSVMALEKSIATSTVAGMKVDFALTDGQRYQNQSGTQQEDHGFSFGVTAFYTE